MAFALHLLHKGEIYYIHRDYGKSTNSPSVSSNMNFALLFALESDAKKFAKKQNLNEFSPKFIPVKIKTEQPKSNYNNYNKLFRRNMNDYLPDFLQE